MPACRSPPDARPAPHWNDSGGGPHVGQADNRWRGRFRERSHAAGSGVHPRAIRVPQPMARRLEPRRNRSARGAMLTSREAAESDARSTSGQMAQPHGPWEPPPRQFAATTHSRGCQRRVRVETFRLMREHNLDKQMCANPHRRRVCPGSTVGCGRHQRSSRPRGRGAALPAYSTASLLALSIAGSRGWHDPWKMPRATSKGTVRRYDHDESPL